MLLIHEVHKVAGRQEEAFDAAYRDELLPTLGQGDDARLLWYLRLAHGSGAAYTVVTITGCQDATAWSNLADRLRDGDLAEWSARVDGMRHDHTAKIVTPVSWSPRQAIDFATVPGKAEEHEPTLFMEDTAWPFAGGLSAYLQKAGTLYDRTLVEAKGTAANIIELEAAYQPVFGTHKTTEVILWQRVVNHKALLWLLAKDVPPEYTAPGTWMHDALEVRDQWESRILRSASWSPLY
ncbi:MAG TPA: hypothetical protein VHV57_04900 [Acidimicrobiales bacterium]|nr:hypothetical protein [Acidimicrobiales bacterium]